MPAGSSPISPDLCAPIGLKYLSSTTFHAGSAFCTSLNTCSIMSFVQPYGLVQPGVGKSSRIGTVFGSP